MEVNRGLLADPFAPFEEMHISPDAVDRVSAPIVASFLEQWSRS